MQYLLGSITSIVPTIFVDVTQNAELQSSGAGSNVVLYPFLYFTRRVMKFVSQGRAQEQIK